MLYFKSNLLFLRRKNKITQDDLSKRLSVGRTTITNYENGTSEPDLEMFSKIVNIFDISADSMLHDDLKDQYESEIDNPYNYDIITKSKFKIPEEKNTGKLPTSYPLINWEAFAGFGSELHEGIDLAKIQDRYDIPLFRGIQVDFLIPVKGSSMYPKYNSGDVVACRLVKELVFVQWNKTYVLDTFSQGVILKRLKKGSTDNTILCKSDNKDYDEFEIPTSEIRSIALVVGVVRLE